MPVYELTGVTVSAVSGSAWLCVAVVSRRRASAVMTAAARARIALIRAAALRPWTNAVRSRCSRAERAAAGADVDAVRELGAQFAAGLDLVRPGDHHRVPRPAQVAGHLLAPLERGVPGVSPGRGEMRRGVIAAQGVDAAVLLDELHLLRGFEHDAVQERHLVERAGDRALHAGAVVTPDIEDERVIQVAHLLDRIQQPAHVPVGVLRIAREHLHLPGIQLLLRLAE